MSKILIHMDISKHGEYDIFSTPDRELFISIFRIYAVEIVLIRGVNYGFRQLFQKFLQGKISWNILSVI